MEEHLVTYFLMMSKKECYTYFLVVVVKQSALVWLDLVLIAIVTKECNSEATFDWLSKQCIYPTVKTGSGNIRFLVLFFWRRELTCPRLPSAKQICVADVQHKHYFQ